LKQSVPLAFRFALRELRGGLRGFGVFIACIALGVAAIAGVASVARGMTEGIAREGQVILGGDISFTLTQRQASAEERAWLDKLGTVSEVATLRGMARRADGSDQALVEVKAVDSPYPLYGAVTVEGGAGASALLADRDDSLGALAEPELLSRLGLKIGDTVLLGQAKLTLRGVLADEPDHLAVGFALGPRLMIARAALAGTGLVQPGSLISWHYRVRLAHPTDAAGLKAIGAAANAAFPTAAWQIRTRDDAAPGLRQNIDRFAEFLTLIGLTALVVGGVGVANAVASFLDAKRSVIATLKCLGAPADFTVAIYFVEILLIAALAGGIGVAIGAAIPFLADAIVDGALPIRLAGVYPAELALGLAYGLLTTVTFALYPLGRAREVSPTALFRDEVSPSRSRPRAAYLVAVAASAAALVALAVGLAADRRIAAIFVAATAGAFLLLRLVAAAIIWITRHAPRRRSAVLRLALGNIYRPGALTASIVLSLGLGLTLVVALVEIDGNFRRELFGAIPPDAPSFFFIDIGPNDRDAFQALIRHEAPDAKLELQPMLRGRLVRLGAVPAEKASVDPDVRWVLDGDRGITFAPAPPPNNKVVAGKWWQPDYAGPPLVSFDGKIAEGLHLKLGDKVTVNVLGRDVTAIVANFRVVEWRTLALNSVMIFSPSAFRGAPFGSLASLAWPDGGTPEREAKLLRRVSAAFPAIAAVRVKEAVATVDRLVNEIAWAIRGASAVTLIAAILVLGGAFAAGRHRRIHDVVVLKTLGATRWRLLAAFALEFLIVGLATAALAVGAGAAAAWLVLKSVMDIDFAFLAGSALLAAVAALLLTLLIGLAGTWRVLGQKAAPVLRNL
jgi:putative ABC transport system permease protein